MRATNITDDCINACIEIFTRALLAAAGCMLKLSRVEGPDKTNHLGSIQNVVI